MPVPIIAAGIGVAGSLASAAIGSGGGAADPDNVNEKDFDLGLAERRAGFGLSDLHQRLKEAQVRQKEAQANLLDFRNRQVQLADMLQQSASGQGPSLADQIGMMQQQQLQTQALSQAASARGSQNLGLANRQVQTQMGQNAQQVAQNTQLAKLQEILDARNQLANLSLNARNQDQAAYNTEAAFAQNAQNDLINRITKDLEAKKDFQRTRAGLAHTSANIESKHQAGVIGGIGSALSQGISALGKEDK